MNLIPLAAALIVAAVENSDGDGLGAEPVVTTEAPVLVDFIDAAQACARRQNHRCTIDNAAMVLRDSATPLALRRDALVLKARAEALSDLADDAVATLRDLRTTGSNWRPEDDDDARIIVAWNAATRPPTPAVLPVPVPESMPALNPPAMVVFFGAGLAVPVGPSGDRLDSGLQADFGLGWLPCFDGADTPGTMAVDLQFRVTWASLPFDDAIIAEPGQNTNLRVFTMTGGPELRFTAAPSWHVLARIGVGAGSFALDPVSSGVAVALTPAVGVRWVLDTRFAIRADFSGVMLVPIESGLSPDGHATFGLQAELFF